LEEIRKYIDWTFFFHAWKLNGRYPEILKDPVKGSEAQKLLDDANNMLDTIVEKKWLKAKAVFGIFPAVAVGDSLEVFDKNNIKISGFHFLRNQEEKEAGIPNLALSDFIAPKETGLTDYVGAFAVTAGLGIEQHLDRFVKDNDDYSAIMLKVLADRLAEALAELLHYRVRKEFWGYAANENLTVKEIIREKYRGIRPAPGYPACPEHSEKATIFNLLEAEKNAGITLTESFAMYPAASVSGYYFAHPEAKYFAVGKILSDQVEDYAKRKGLTVEEVEKLLRINLVEE
jgi:5-methyltetrahydrofolate--homocysteine methyltransferase